MMKDRGLKAQLLSFFVGNGWYPQLEVDVMTEESSSSNLKLITDIDVLGMYPSSSGSLNPIIGDCKTLKNQSPINRVLWMKGLMDYWQADRGIILLQKKIEIDHKHMSDRLGITLLSDHDFISYSKAFGTTINANLYAIGKVENWENYFQEFTKYPFLTPIFKYVKYEFWNEKSSTKSIRGLLSNVRKSRGEFNPSTNAHLAIFCDLVSLFALAINDITIQLFKRFPLPELKSDFETELKMLIWGGYDNYKFLNDLRSKIIGPNESELELPEWNRFIQMMRNFLEAPLGTQRAPLILKELGFQILSNQNEIAFIHDSSPHSLKCALLMVQYFAKATKLPEEFADRIISRLMKSSRESSDN